jgi:hypothetical protein
MAPRWHVQHRPCLQVHQQGGQGGLGWRVWRCTQVLNQALIHMSLTVHLGRQGCLLGVGQHLGVCHAVDAEAEGTRLWPWGVGYSGGGGHFYGGTED